MVEPSCPVPGDVSRLRPRLAWLALLVVALVATAAPDRALGASPVTAFYAGPVASGSPCNAAGDGAVPARRASAFTDFCVAYSTLTDPPADPEDDDLRSMVIDTPLGFAANAAAIPTCPLEGPEGFNPGTSDDVGCAQTSQVGNATAGIRSVVDTASGVPIPIRIPTLPGRVFNLTPGDREVALLGVVLDPKVIIDQPKVKVVVRVTLRPAPDVGLRAVIDDLPREADVAPPVGGPIQRQPLAVDRFGLSFWGTQAAHPSMPADFAFVGSDCARDQRTSLRAVSYDGTPTTGDATPYRLTDCDDTIPFAPSLEVGTAETRPDVTTASSVTVRFGASSTPGLVPSTIRRAVVTLPEGLSLSGQIASGPGGLRLCPTSAFGPTTVAPNACPAGSDVGTVRIASPALVTPLTGEVFLGPQSAPGELPDLFVEAALSAAADAPRVKLRGSLVVAPSGRLTATLDDLPQLPVSEFALAFRGGDRSVLVTPPACGTQSGSLVASPEARPDQPVTTTSDYTVSTDCDGVGGFAPGLSFVLDDPASAGKSTPLSVGIARRDRSERIASTSINLPPGMLASLKGVAECPTSAALAGTCAADSRVGSVDTFAGVGRAPLQVSGDVFLTERRPPAVAGLVFRVPVVFGDVDLGVLNVPADVYIRDNGEGLRVEAQLPERYRGIPLNLQALVIRLDRPGFALSPTSCIPLRATSQLRSTTGAVASVTAGLQVSGCEALPFAPVLETAVSGATSEGNRPFTQVRVTSPVGSSALRQAFVTLPQGLGFDLKQVARACSIEDFLASSCPPVASIGKVYGSLAITDEPLEGQLYLLRPTPGEVLPGIGLAFEGRFAANIAGQTRIDQRTGQLFSSFASVPDLPLTSFQIDVAGGTTGVLISTKTLCAEPSVAFKAVFVSSTGTNAARDSASFCGVRLGEGSPIVSGRMGGLRRGTPTLALRVTAPKARAGAPQKKIRRVDVRVPSSWSISTSRAKRSSGVAVKGLSVDGRPSTRKASAEKIRITMPSAGTTTAKVLTRTGTVRTRTASARRTTRQVAIGVTVLYTDGSSVSGSELLKPR